MVEVNLKIQNEAACDGKTTIWKLKTIRLRESSTTYVFPSDRQDLKAYHSQLLQIDKIKKVCKSMTKRGQYRNISIVLNEDIAKLYMDDNFDMVFEDYYLEELIEDPIDKPELVGKLLTTSFNPQSDLKSITKNFILEPFTGKNQNTEYWLETFESECKRFGIKEENMFEIMRLFLENGAKDWYTSVKIKYGLQTPWYQFKESFKTTFIEKGWSNARFVYLFKHISGSLVEYALKKERMLLSRDPKMAENIRIDLIVIGLPIFIQEKLDKEKLQSIEHLINEIRKPSKGEKFIKRIIKVRKKQE